jgi:hypothetical protein
VLRRNDWIYFLGVLSDGNLSFPCVVRSFESVMGMDIDVGERLVYMV